MVVNGWFALVETSWQLIASHFDLLTTIISDH